MKNIRMENNWLRFTDWTTERIAASWARHMVRKKVRAAIVKNHLGELCACAYAPDYLDEDQMESLRHPQELYGEPKTMLRTLAKSAVMLEA